MAQFDYESYAAQQANRRNASGSSGGKSASQTHFINEYLKNDGDSVVVRFPYHSLDDIKFETTHTVTFPGDKFGKRVRCEGAGCSLCKQGIKLDTRFFVTAIVYVTDPATGTVSLVPAIWDRPAAFADIDLKNLIMEYGDLSENLFKIKRNGMGLDTRYTISIIMNKTVYKPEVYVADFSGLENVDPVRILTKSVEQYMAAINPNAKEETTEEVVTPSTVVEPAAPVQTPQPSPVSTPAVEVELEEKPVSVRPKNRYTF